MPGRFIIFVQNIEKQIAALKRQFTTITFDLWGMNLHFKIYFTCTKSSSKFRSYACRSISIITGRSNLEYPRFWLSWRKNYVLYFSHDNPAVTLLQIVYFWPWEPNPSETWFNKPGKTWNRQRNIFKLELNSKTAHNSSNSNKNNETMTFIQRIFVKSYHFPSCII